MGRLLINCDLGENETDEQTRRLFGLIDAASIGCGVHAGNTAKTRRTLQIAASAGHPVLIGAHPGLATAGGRGRDLPGVADFRDLVAAQVLQFLALADEQGVPVTYVKLHGSLYHAVEQRSDYAEAYLALLAALDRQLGVLALAGGPFARQAAQAGIPGWSEVFADRAYLQAGMLAQRALPGAVLHPAAALARLTRWLASGMMETIDGQPIPLQADTLCIHSDTPEAAMLLQKIRQLID